MARHHKITKVIKFCSDLNQQGFTIVELMISLSILSVILIISTVALVDIGGLYDKGVSASNLQNATRNIMADVTAGIQFSKYSPQQCSSTPTAGILNCTYTPPYPYTYQLNGNTYEIDAYCIGTARYTYVNNVELGKDSSTGVSTPYILWRDTLQSPLANCVPANNMKNSEMGSGGVNPTNPDSNTSANSGYEMMANHTQIKQFSISLDSNLGINDAYIINLSAAYGDNALISGSGSNISCKSQLGQTASDFCSTSTSSSTITGRLY